MTYLVREAHKVDRVAQVANRKRKATEKHEAQIRKQARTAASRDKAEETATTSLVRDLTQLNLQLKARCNNKESRVTLLKDQIYARIGGECPRLYPGLGDEWRKQGGKIRISAPSKNQTAEDYLMKLLAAMMKEDSATCGINETNVAFHTQDYIRAVPSIALDFTNPKSIAYKKEFSKQIADLATPVDDPTYIELHAKYNGAILFDNETRATQKLFRIAAIQFVRSFSANRHSCWEATCEPVYRDAKSKQFLVPHELTVEGSNVLLATALQGYALTEYPDGIENDAVYLPWVDNYIAHFKNVVEPTFAATVDSTVAELSAPLQPTRTRLARRQ